MKIIVTERQLKFLVEQIDTKGLGNVKEPIGTEMDSETDCEKVIKIANEMGDFQKAKNKIKTLVTSDRNWMGFKDRNKEFYNAGGEFRIQDYVTQCGLGDPNDPDYDPTTKTKLKPELKKQLKGKPIPHRKGSVGGGTGNTERTGGMSKFSCGPGGCLKPK